MSRTEQAKTTICRLDEQAGRDTVIHRLNPFSKLIWTVTYIAITTSYNKYDLTGISVMVLFPTVLYQLSQTSVRECFYRLRFILPFVCAVGIANPFFDKEVILWLGDFGISGGIVSMVTLIIKSILCLMMSYLLIATTSIEEICVALQQIHLPDILVTLLLLTYRYVLILLGEVTIMSEAYSLRAPGQRGIHINSWGSFLGQLILRSMDRAQALYESMVLRGYDGRIKYFGNKRYNRASYIVVAVGIAMLVLTRCYNILQLLERIIK